MPLYEYKCGSCGEVFEVIQKFSDSPLSVHEKCGGAVERLISASALQFKGSGWYVTDYGKGGSKPAPSNGGDKAEKAEKAEKSDKSDKSDKPGKAKDSTPKADAPAASTTTPKTGS